MKHESYMQPKDWDELAEINVALADVRKRRVRLRQRIRQRALRDRLPTKGPVALKAAAS